MRSGFDSALAAHIAGTKRPDTAVPRPGLEPTVLMDEWGKPIGEDEAAGQLDRAKKSMVAAKARHKRRGIGGRKPTPCGEWVFAGVPLGTPPDKVQEWATASVSWLKDRLPDQCRFGVVSLHQDEAHAHVHVLIGFQTADGLYGWNRAQKNTRWARGGRRRADLMSAMQDDYHRVVGSRFGMERGQVGRGGGNEPLDRSESLRRRVAELEQEKALRDKVLAVLSARGHPVHAVGHELGLYRDPPPKPKPKERSAGPSR